VTNGGQEMTVVSIVDHVLLHVTDAQDQMLTIVKTVLKTHTTRLMEHVIVVMSGWVLPVTTSDLIAMSLVRSVCTPTITNVLYARMDLL
jgi:hypothetical protein